MDAIGEQARARCASVVLGVLKEAVVDFDSMMLGKEIAVVGKDSPTVTASLANAVSVGVIVERTDSRYIRFRMEKLVVLRPQAYTESARQNYARNC
jgi:hypothetical protein